MRMLRAFALAGVLAAGATVKDDRTPLRRGCDSDGGVVATLPQDTPVTIRYALSGESVPCYKVQAEMAGRSVEGFLPADALNGLEEFDKARREGKLLDLTPALGRHSSAPDLPALKVGTRDKTAAEAASMIESGQPARALELLEPELKKQATVDRLTLAGVAAWQSDRSGRALEYLREALARGPSPPLESLYHQVEREARNDKSGDLLIGLRVQLRYQASAIPVDTARQLLAALDQEFTRVSAELGCAPDERVIAIAQSREAYRQTTNAAEWNGGQFDGKIRVPVSEEGMDGVLRRTLAHEVVHACMSLLGRWPVWLQEGIAQKLSGAFAPPAVRSAIANLARQGQLPKLGDLGQDWSRMDTARAELAYGLALRAVEVFTEEYAALGLRNLLHNPERLTAITADLDRRLGLAQ